MDSVLFVDLLFVGVYLCDIVLCLKSELFLLLLIVVFEWIFFVYCEWCNVFIVLKE